MRFAFFVNDVATEYPNYATSGAYSRGLVARP